MARLDAGEMTAVRWILGQLLVLISLAGCYGVDLGASWLVSLSLLMLLPACLVPSWLERLPRLVWTVLTYLMIIGIVLDFSFSGGDILPPLFRMVLLLTLYRSLQIRTAREDLQVLLLSLFLIIVTGVFSQDIVFGVQIVFYTPLAIGLLFAANLSTNAVTGKSIEKGGRVFNDLGWRLVWKRIRERFDRRTLLAGAGVFLFTSILTFLLFVFLPRFDIGAALPFPRLQTSQSLTGFTDHVQYGDVVSILNDDTIAMRVDVEMENPPAQPYWRMVVLDSYYNGGFMVSPRVARERDVFTNNQFSFEGMNDPSLVDNSVWTLYMEGGVSSYMPVGDAFRRIRFNHQTRLELHGLTRVFKMDGTNANTVSIRFEGLTFPGRLPVVPDDRELEGISLLKADTSGPNYLQEVSYPETLTVVPDGEENEKVMRKVLESIGYIPGMPVREFSGRLIEHLRKGRGYSLESRIPDGSADSLLRWVDSGEAGHCELYAGAFVLISRYAGFPARLVVGFAGGDWNGFENYYVVRNRNAHAWCEIFSPGNGWLRMDPTPGYGSESGTVENALATGGIHLDRTWQAYLDSLRVLWYRRVIQFDSTDQEALALAAKDLGSGGMEWVARTFRNWRDALKTDLNRLIKGGDWSGIFGDAIGPLLVLLLICVVMMLVRKIRRRQRFEQIVRKRAGELLRYRGEVMQKEHPDTYATILAIRYGAVENWPEDIPGILKAARKA